MADEEKELSLEERRRRLEERRKELERKRAELRQLAEQVRQAAERRQATPGPTAAAEKPAPGPAPPAARERDEPPPTAERARAAARVLEPKLETPVEQWRQAAPAVEELKPPPPRVERPAPAPAPERVEKAPAGPPPIPPPPPPERRGRGVLVAAITVIIVAAAALAYLIGTGKLGGVRRGEEPTEEELQAARADSIARVQYDVQLGKTEVALATAEELGAEEDAPEEFALAVAARDSAARLEAAGDLAAAVEMLLVAEEQAQLAGDAAETVAQERLADQARREEELRAAAALVAAAQESLAAVEALEGRRYAARPLAQLDSILQTASTAVEGGDPIRARRSLARLTALLTEARGEIATAKEEEEEVRRRLEQQRQDEEEERRRQEEEARRAAMESTPPQIVELATPVYPPLARAAGVQGTVVLDFLVDGDGSVRDIEVVAGPSALGEAAKDALLRSTIRPATQGGQPVAARMQQRFTFRL